MIDWSTCPAVEQDPAVLSGAWVFRGTRVPVAALFENLEDDATVHQFIEWFQGVSAEQARCVLEHAARSSFAVAWVLVLFDQGTPAPLRHALVGHVVETGYERGWSRLKNGELIATAQSAGFDVFVTTDKNLRYQQNLDNRDMAIVVLHTTSWPRIQQALPKVVAAVAAAIKGSYIEIDAG